MLEAIEPWFSRDYRAARDLFRLAASRCGVAVDTITHPLTGPDGDILSADVARVGPACASQLLVLTSGMHGPELYCGSGVQCALLALGHLGALPPDTAVLLVHAINPWGSAHVRRVTENNVDPCRNFIDFDLPVPANPDYLRLHSFFGQSGVAGEVAKQAHDAQREQLGEQAYLRALMSGQYTHPDGFSYGGSAPEWTNRTMTSLLRKHGERAERVATIDFHSGVGPWGYGLAVVVADGTVLERARRWYGRWLLAPNDSDEANGTGYPVTGHSCEGYARALPDKEVTAMVLEFGTFPAQRFAKAMTDDHWLAFHGDAVSREERDAIKQELAELFNPNDAEWRAAVWYRARQAIRQALTGLALHND